MHKLRPVVRGAEWLCLAVCLLAASERSFSQTYNLSQDFSTSDNPNGVWSYGAKGTIGGPFSLLSFSENQSFQAGLTARSWEWSAGVQPVITCYTGTTTLVIAGGDGVFPPGTVTCDAGSDGSPQNFVVVRFTVPPHSDGSYQIQTSVHSKYNGGSSQDSDFHVVQNGVEIFGRFLSPNANAGYTNTLALVAGDKLDLMIGRGADGLESASGLKLQATVTLLSTNAVAPSILSQPQSQSAIVGNDASFSVTASGTPAPTYVWFHGSDPVPSGTNSVLLLKNVQFGDAGSYSVVVSNVMGRVPSDSATLTVNAAPDCAPPPDGLVAWWGLDGNTDDLAGSGALAVAGTASYVAGEVAQALVLGGSASSARAAASSPLNVGVSSGLSIEAWINPTDASRLEDLVEWNNGAGSIGTHFSIATPTSYGGGSGSLFANLVDTGGTSHQITTGTGLLTSGVFQHVALTYEKASGITALYLNGDRVAVTNLGSFTPQTTYDLYLGVRPSGPLSGLWFTGAIDELSVYNRALSSNEIHTVWQASLAGKCKVAHAPTISSQPQNATTFEGGQAVFRVSAAGTAPLSYSWFFNSNLVADASSSTLVLTNVQSDQAGYYSVIVSNTAGWIKSDEALLTVNAAPGCATTPDGLAAWWPFDGSTDDLVGSSEMGLSGAPQYASGEVSQALVLGGSTAYGKANANPSLDVGASSGLSIEAWINPNDASQMADLLEWNNQLGSIGAHFSISVPNSYGGGAGCLFANLVDVSGTSHQVTSVPGLLVSGVFQHVAVTYEKASGLAALYLNGSQVAATNLGSFVPQTTYDLFLGLRPSGPIAGMPFHGLVDELSLYARALTATEVQSIYTSSVSGKCKVARAPTILTQPQNVVSYTGGNAIFKVAAAGTSPLSYQWFFNSNAVQDATSATLVLTNIQPGQAGTYSVVVSNVAGSVPSDSAILTINPPPSCAPQPDGLVAWWSFEGTGSDEVGGNELVLAGATADAEGEVGEALSLNGSSSYAKASASASLNIGLGSGLSVEGWIYPANAAELADLVEWNDGQGNIGSHVSVSVPTAFGGGSGSLYANLVDAWGVSHQITTTAGLLANNVFQHVAITYDKPSGVASIYLNGLQVATANLGTFVPQTSYDLFLGTRPSGPVSGQWFAGRLDEVSLYNRALTASEVQAISAAAVGGKCKTPLPPSITAPLQNQTQPEGGTATFAVGVSGTRPLLYHWEFNGSPISDGSNSTLVLANLRPDQDGNYTVIVSNAYGSATSGPVRLVVQLAGHVAPTITAQPLGVSIPVGSNALVSVTATGPQPIVYQWFWNDAPVAQGTNQTLSFHSAQLSQAGTYFAVVSNPYGAVTSSAVVVNINDYQGGAVFFGNYFGSSSPYVFDVDGMTRLQGPTYLAQLYAGTNETTLLPVGAASPFRTGNLAGIFVNGVRYISGVPPGGLATVQVRAWDAQKGPTFEQAMESGGRAGASPSFTVQTAGGIPPAPPTWLLGLQSFSLQTNSGSLSLTNGAITQSSPPLLLEPQLDPGPAPAEPLAAARAPLVASQVTPRAFHFTIWGEVGKTYTIEASTDLRAWVPITNILNTVGPMQVSDPASSSIPARFYRVRTSH